MKGSFRWPKTELIQPTTGMIDGVEASRRLSLSKKLRRLLRLDSMLRAFWLKLWIVPGVMIWGPLGRGAWPGSVSASGSCLSGSPPPIPAGAVRTSGDFSPAMTLSFLV